MERRWRVGVLLGMMMWMHSLKGVHCVQRFEQQPSYTEVNPHQDALLVCKVFNKRGFCSWQKDNKPVGMYKDKYEWAGSQELGDCSIWIRSAQLQFDDGIWECQVTASDFHTQDALTSQPVRLVVRVAPQTPRIEYNGSQVLPGHNLTALHGIVAVIKCVSHYGNPPPILKWFLDQNEITPSRKQTNTTEADNPRTWLALSILELTISKENHGRIVRCVAVHESYSTKSSSIEVRLDVMYVPETRLIGIPTNDIEELKDNVAVRCAVSANPRAAVVWRREGQSQPASLQELLQFSPAVRQHAGLYTCVARNKAGESQPVRVHIDVKYPPKILSVDKDRVKTATLFASANFECVGEGNPLPTYQWLQTLPTPSNVVLERGREAKLLIPNVTYDFQGEYRCKVTNVINGKERSELSYPIILQVVGAPQVLRHTVMPEIMVEKGETAHLSMVVCADPRPRIVAWEWGSLRLEEGNEMGRYKVDKVTQEEREDCYLSTLHIKDASAMDSRAYYLTVENDKGKDRHAIQLYVNEPFQMSTLVSLAGGALVAFLLLICACIYAIRTEKCCFARKGDFKPTDLDSEKLDIEKNSTGMPGGIPADAIYTTTPRSHRTSPDAMKQTAQHTTFNGSSSLEDGRMRTTAAANENVYCGVAESRHYLKNNPYDTKEITPRYHTFNRYHTVDRSCDYFGTAVSEPPQAPTSYFITHRTSLPSDSKYARRSKNKRQQRPKPLQYENEKYYDLVFPKREVQGSVYYQPGRLEHAEL